MRPDPDEGEKRTNEIGTLLPLLDTVPDIAGHTLTTDALLTQRALATSLLGRGVHDLVTVKGNQPTLLDDIRLTLDEDIAQRAPDFTDQSPKPEHGRRERRSIRVSSAPDHFPRCRTGLRRAPRHRRRPVRQAPPRDRLRRHQPHPSRRIPPNACSPSIAGTGPSRPPITSSTSPSTRTAAASAPATAQTNMTRLRRFAIGLIKARGLAVAETMRRLARNPRRGLDFLEMTANVCPRTAPA